MTLILCLCKKKATLSKISTNINTGELQMFIHE